MIVDSSALVAILRREAEASSFEAAIEADPRPRMSAVSFLETSFVAGPERFDRVDQAVREAEIEVVAFDLAQAHAARTAHERYGKGSGSPARLNFGDCMTYALAKVTGEALLFKGDDFAHTDVISALGQEALGDQLDGPR